MNKKGPGVRPVRPDLAKFCNFGKIIKSIWAISWKAYLVFSNILCQLWHFYATGPIVIVVNGQRLNSIIAIWSHWWRLKIINNFTWIILNTCSIVFGDVVCQRRFGDDLRRVMWRHIGDVSRVRRTVNQLWRPGGEDRGGQVRRGESDAADALQFRRALAEGNVTGRIARVKSLL